MSAKEKLLLLVLASINFTHIVDFMILMPLGPQLMELLRIDPAQFGMVVASYGASAGVSGFMLSFIADRFDRKKLLLMAYFGFLLGTFACARSDTYEQLLAARVLSGIFGGLIGAQVMAIVADTFSYERRATAMSVVMTAFSFASVVGVPGGLYLAEKMDWHTPFYAVGFLGLLVWVLAWRLVPSISEHLRGGSHTHPLDLLKGVVADKNQSAALLFSIVMMLGHFSTIPYITPYLVGNVGYAQSDIYLVYLVGGALTIFSAPVVGRLADRFGKQKVFATFLLLSLVPIWLITNLWRVEGYVVLLITSFFFVATNGRMIPSQALVSSVVTPRQRGGFMAINSSVQLLAQAAATSIGGALIAKSDSGVLTGYHQVGYFAIAFLLLSLFFARRIRSIA